MMNAHTTFQLGGPAKFFIKPKSINKIIKVLKLSKEYSIEYFILGNGSNLLVSDDGFDGLFIYIYKNIIYYIFGKKELIYMKIIFPN